MSKETPVKVLRTNKTLSSAIRQRHPWVFRDALPKKVNLPNASPVQVLDKNGHYLGDGLYETEGDIGVRLWNFNSEPVSRQTVEKNIRGALARPMSSDESFEPKLANSNLYS